MTSIDAKVQKIIFMVCDMGKENAEAEILTILQSIQKEAYIEGSNDAYKAIKEANDDEF